MLPRLRTALLAAFGLALALPGCHHAPPPPPPTPVEQHAGLTLRALDIDSGVVANYSGFSAGPGLIVTARHGLAKRMPIAAVLADGRQAALGHPVAEDAAADLIVLSAGDDLPVEPLPLAPEPVPAGEWVRVVTQRGIARAAVRGATVTPNPADSRLVIDAPGLKAGAAGSAVVDDAGRVVAVVVGSADDHPSQALAVPAARVAALVERARAAKTRR
ncbi:MAG TPA: serine protease [Humisphaera sp.]